MDTTDETLATPILPPTTDIAEDLPEATDESKQLADEGEIDEQALRRALPDCRIEG